MPDEYVSDLVQEKLSLRSLYAECWLDCRQGTDLNHYLQTSGKSVCPVKRSA